MKKKVCNTCGYTGTKPHDLYDCMDVLDPTWMYKWWREIKKEKSGMNHTTSSFVRWSKKFPVILILSL